MSSVFPPQRSVQRTPSLVPPAGMTLHQTLKGHVGWVTDVAWSPDGQQLASTSGDGTVRLWNLITGTLRTLKGHTGWVRSVAWSPSGLLLAFGTDDAMVRLWDPLAGRLLSTFKGHSAAITSVVWSPDGQQLASASGDGTVRLWNPATGTLMRIFEGHQASTTSVAWSPDGQQLASASGDGTVRLWNPVTGTPMRILQHQRDLYHAIRSVAWSPDGQRLACAVSDKTVQIWNPTTGRLSLILEGHLGKVNKVLWSPDEQLLLSSADCDYPSYEAEVCLWGPVSLEPLAMLSGLKGSLHTTWHPHLPLIATAGQRAEDIAVWQIDVKRLLGLASSQKSGHYTNAKVVLVGDSGVGKSGLGLVLTKQQFTPTDSTHGRHIWVFDSQELIRNEHISETREILLWDLAGQPGYRLIHQLHLNEIAVAIVVFDAHSETDPFSGVRHWDRALRLAQRIQDNNALPLKKLLVAARIDRGGVGVSAERVQALMHELHFDGYFETSAKENWQIARLRMAIIEAINWELLPKVSSTALFQQIKHFLVEEKQHARWLLSTAEDLYRVFLRTRNVERNPPELQSQFETCLGRVESAGLLRHLSFGNLVLLQPELLDAYASALVNAVKDEPDGLGSIAEEQARTGNFRMPTKERIADIEQEKLLLIAMIEDLLRRELVLREEGMLVFPSQSTKEHPDLPNPEGKTVTFTFEGPVLNIYATLAVRLARSGWFQKQGLWKNAITYTALAGGTCGLALRNSSEGQGELTLFVDQGVSRETRQVFEEYVKLHLVRRALPEGFRINRLLTCSQCNTSIPDQIVQLRKARNPDWLLCPVCDTRIPLIDQEQPKSTTPSPRTLQMDRAADAKREHEAATLTLQGKIETGDFDVFLCHHSIDKPLVKQIGGQLKEHGILPWLDEWELRPGLPWQRLLEEHISHIHTACVFVGNDGIGPWQQQELDALLREFVRRGAPVIPILLPNAPQEPSLPIFLQGMTWVDFRTQDPDPLQRLLWGITGTRGVDEKTEFGVEL